MMGTFKRLLKAHIWNVLKLKPILTKTFKRRILHRWFCMWPDYELDSA